MGVSTGKMLDRDASYFIFQQMTVFYCLSIIILSDLVFSGGQTGRNDDPRRGDRVEAEEEIDHDGNRAVQLEAGQRDHVPSRSWAREFP